MVLVGCGQTPPVQTPTPTNQDKKVTPSPSHVGHEVISSEGGFKITFPEPPVRKADKSRDGKPTENYYYQNSEKALVIGFSYPPIPIPKEQLNELLISGGLEGAVESFVRETKGVITQKMAIRLGDFQGLEFQSKTTGATPRDSGVTKGRVYWVEGKLIRLVAIGQPAWMQTKEVDDFFQSFSLSNPK